MVEQYCENKLCNFYFGVTKRLGRISDVFDAVSIATTVSEISATTDY